jgi:hypothetical protein
MVGALPEKRYKKALPNDLALEFINRETKVGGLSQALDRICKSIDEGNEVFISLKDISSAEVFQTSATFPMAVVGYIKDSNGIVRLLKIKNSWRNSVGKGHSIYLSRKVLAQVFDTAAIMKQTGN